MRADVFQAVALCCHANAYLSGSRERTPELITNSTFLPVHEVTFERTGTGKLASGIVADAPGPWLRRLTKEGVERIGLSLAGCPFDPLLAPQEPWGILSDGDVGVEIWQPAWKKRLRNHSDTSPWRVCYTASRSGRWLTHAPVSLSDTAKHLISTIRQTAGAHPLLNDLLQQQDPVYPDIFPAGWPSEQRRLGEVAAHAAALIRSEEWAQVLLRREIVAADHEAISLKLWRAALMAFEAAARMEEGASARPTAHSFPLAG